MQNLQEEIKSQQPHLNALQRQYEQVKQHASPDGAKALKSKLDAVKTAYANIADEAAERQATLTNAVRHRQDFYGHLQDFEKWLKKSQRKLDTGNEIYADEVGEMKNKLKVNLVSTEIFRKVKTWYLVDTFIKVRALFLQVYLHEYS